MSRRPLAAVAALLALAGCAVTKIDVDVYKGPLANHEDVRLQQFVVLASAAKPFLVRLRDTLEWGDCAIAAEGQVAIAEDSELGRKTRGLRAYLKQQCEERIKRGEIRKTDPDKTVKYDLAGYEADHMPEHSWRNIKAERVNAILSLYKNLTDEELQSFAAKAAPALGRYDDVTPILEYRVDPDLWGRLLKGVKPAADVKLLAAYRLLLDPSEDPKNVRRGIRLQEEKVKANLKDAHIIDALYEHLEKPDVVREDAKALFADPKGKEADEFVAAVNRFARSFRLARESLSTIWRAANEALILLYDLPAPQATEQQRKRERLMRGLAALIAQTTQPEYANFALCRAGTASYTALRDALHSQGGVSWKIAEWTPDQRLIAVSDIERQLRMDPKQTATIFIEADKQLRQQNSLKGDADCLKPASWKRARDFPYVAPPYGLVRGPTTGRGQDAPDLDLAGLLAGAGVGVANGLEHARHIEGIETLADRYVDRSRPDRKPPIETVTQARELLTTALVGFAEKVAFLANHDVLEEDGSRPTGRVNRYRVVLQAIGNALMVQADDIRRVDSHKRRIAAGGPTERRALDAALNQTPTAYLTSLVTSARAAAEAAETAKGLATKANADAQAALEKLKTDLPTLEAKAIAGKAKQIDRTEFKKIDAAYTVLSERAESIREGLGSGTAPAADVLAAVKALPLPEETRSYLGEQTVSKALTEINIKDAAGNDKDKAAVFTDMLAHIKARRDLAEKLADAEAAPEKAYEEAVAARDQAAEKAKTTSDAASKATTDAAMAKAVAGHLERLRAETLKPGQAPDNESAHAAYERFRARLDAEHDAATDTKLAELKQTRAFVAARNPPLAPFRVPEGSPSENARDVLDSIIAVLREEHILATREDPDSPRTKSIGVALKTAFDHRGGMAYLRPAIAYLRSSYAASSLQDDSGATGWKNLLDESRGRAWPFISEGVTNWQKEERQAITSEIDKQFWQTINSVRVSGAGLTNYVMVKDDIGNWYVKQYSADPSSMIASARALVSFNLGVPGPPSPAPKPTTAADPAAAAAEPAANAAAAGTGSSAPAASDASGPLDRLISRYKADHAERTGTTYDDAMKLVETLSGRITEAWDADPALTGEGAKPAGVHAKLGTQLDAAKATFQKDIDKLKEVKVEDRGNAIVDALRAGRIFHFTLRTNLGIALRGDPDGEAAAAKAADYATVAARAVLGDLARVRKDQLTEYRRSVTFIGDANK